jgi:hypothetical protein
MVHRPQRPFESLAARTLDVMRGAPVSAAARLAPTANGSSGGKLVRYNGAAVLNGILLSAREVLLDLLCQRPDKREVTSHSTHVRERAS